MNTNRCAEIRAWLATQPGGRGNTSQFCDAKGITDPEERLRWATRFPLMWKDGILARTDRRPYVYWMVRAPVDRAAQLEAARSITPKADLFTGSKRSQVRQYIAANPGQTRAQITAGTGLPKRDVNAAICDMHRHKMLSAEGRPGEMRFSVVRQVKLCPRYATAEDRAIGQAITKAKRNEARAARAKAKRHAARLARQPEYEAKRIAAMAARLAKDNEKARAAELARLARERTLEKLSAQPEPEAKADPYIPSSAFTGKIERLAPGEVSQGSRLRFRYG